MYPHLFDGAKRRRYPSEKRLSNPCSLLPQTLSPFKRGQSAPPNERRFLISTVAVRGRQRFSFYREGSAVAARYLLWGMFKAFPRGKVARRRRDGWAKTSKRALWAMKRDVFGAAVKIFKALCRRIFWAPQEGIYQRTRSAYRNLTGFTAGAGALGTKREVIPSGTPALH